MITMELYERVKLLIDNKKMSITKFASTIGYRQNTFNEYVKPDGRKRMPADVVEKILQAYPEVSAEWLMRGVGEMYGLNLPQVEYQMKELEFQVWERDRQLAAAMTELAGLRRLLFERERKNKGINGKLTDLFKDVIPCGSSEEQVVEVFEPDER